MVFADVGFEICGFATLCAQRVDFTALQIDFSIFCKVVSKAFFDRACWVANTKATKAKTKTRQRTAKFIPKN